MADTGGTPGNSTAGSGETPPPGDTSNNNEGAAKSGEQGAEGESVEGLRSALKAERDSRKALEKTTRDFETRIREFEDRDKSELEKAAQRASEAEARVADFEHRELARTIAAAAEIPDAWDLLHGDEETMKAQAARLVERFGGGDGGRSGSDYGAGARGGTSRTGSAGFSDQIRRQIARK